jgi:hypothetical protein
VSVRALRVAFAAALLGMALVPAAAAAADANPELGQDVTLDGLGIGAQTVYGAHGATEVAFPPAATTMAPTGSYVRVFFSHSVDVVAGSTMLIAVNGQPLLTVPLASGTAAGGVLETRLPAPLLDQRQPTRLQVRFSLVGPTASLYGRIDGQTTLHYELAPAPSGQADLSQYPFALLAADAPRPALGVVLPVTPDAQDLAAAFRVLADLGRRTASQRVQPKVVTADQESWLAAGGVSALIIGRIDRLPAAPTVLQAAGWRRSGAGWAAPGGQTLGPDDGLVLAAISPWDHRTPLLLVTGGSAAGVARAAAALVGGGPALTGPSVVVSDATAAAPLEAPRVLRISLLSPRDLGSFGTGRYRATVSFAAPAVDPDDTVVMELTLPALGASVPSGTVEADLNGSWVTSAALGATRPGRLEASFSGRLLRPGRNALSLEFRIDSGAGQAPPLEGAFTTAGPDTATAQLSLPAPSSGAGDLRMLPYPFLEGGQALQVVVADGTTATLAAAAQALLGLGSRSTQPPPALRVAFASGWDSSGQDGLVVIGRPPASSALRSMAAQLPVVFDGSGRATMAGPGGARVSLSTSVGAVQELRTADASARPVLWLAGTGPDVLAGAAAALYDPSVSGTAALVDASGRLSSLSGGGGPFAGLGPGTAQVAGAAAALLILVVVALQLLLPRRRRR